MKHAPIRLFANPLLERLTHVSPPTIIALWGLVIGFLWVWAWGRPGFALWPAALGWLAWTLFEYVLHRWVFHWQPGHPALRRLVFTIHGIHHVQPFDGTRVMMPPAASVPLAATLWGLCALVLPAPARDVFFAGFLMGYLQYDVTHWACHRRRFGARLGRHLKRHHLLHHHVEPDRNFGVSTPLWDRVFGTVIGPGEHQS